MDVRLLPGKETNPTRAAPNGSPGYLGKLEGSSAEADGSTLGAAGASGHRFCERGFLLAGWGGMGLAPEAGGRGAGTLIEEEEGGRGGPQDGRPNSRPALQEREGQKETRVGN